MFRINSDDFYMINYVRRPSFKRRGGEGGGKAPVQTFTISGNCGVGLATLTPSWGLDAVTADASGTYSVEVWRGWSGDITPSLTNYIFAAASKTYVNVVENYTNEDYVAAAILTLSAVVTDGQTVTLTKVTPTGGNSIVDWGDGGATTTITDGNTAVKTHLYATGDTYAITLTNPALITALELRDAKVGCASGQIGSLTNLTNLYLRDLANVTVGTGEIGLLTKLTYLSFNNLANVTVGIGEIGLLTKLGYLYIQTAANVTVGTGEIGLLTGLKILYLYNSANVTIGTGEIRLLTSLTNLYLKNLANVAVQSTDFETLIKATWILYENSLSSPQVDAALSGLWTMFASRTGVNGTITIAFSNGAPGGTYQAANPPTTGEEFKYELLNDSQNVNPTKKWTAVITTA